MGYLLLSEEGGRGATDFVYFFIRDEHIKNQMEWDKS